MRLAVIGTFFRRYEESRAAIRAVLESTRVPDEFWIMCETDEDHDNACLAVEEVGPVKCRVEVIHLPTKRLSNGSYAVIPYSNKINYALAASDADAYVYLDNGSLPHSRKYEIMLATLEAFPEWGAVYCAQHRTGYCDQYSWADRIVPDAFCVLNFTQVMHRKSPMRWDLDMHYALPNDIADALFWRKLHAYLGDFYPAFTDFVLDEHHIPSSAANGLEGDA